MPRPNGTRRRHKVSAIKPLTSKKHWGSHEASSKKALNHIGLEVRRIGKPARGASQNTFLSAYHGAVLALLANREKLHVVVVGANDGKYNDPIYDLIQARLADFTKITLLEPQKN